MTDLVYGRAAPVYRQHGWQGPLPLPEGAKAHPPAGYTGATGIWPTDAQIADWCEQLPCGNIALRLPEGVIGIDIDAYLDKQGDVSLLALEASLGTLPATWRSTSREVLRKSGIYLYRVPPGRYHDKPAPNIEVIQHHHRYVVVMPSIHPEGRPYLWYDADGVEQRRPPHVEELAELPEAWVEHLREKPRTEGQREHRHHAVDDWTPAVTKAFTRALMDMPGGRHDAALHGALALCRLIVLDHPGAHQALSELSGRFKAAIADRSIEREADREWDDIVSGAMHIVETTPATAPKWETWKPGASAYGPDWQWWEDKKEDSAESQDPGMPRFAGLIDWPAFWQADHADEDWLIEPFLARGRSHALYAPAKAGKSLLALEVAAAASTGRPVFGQLRPSMVVAYVDFEMTESDVHERLTDLAYGPDDDLRNLHYYLLPDLPPLDTPAGGQLLVGEAIRIGADLVVVDTVARTIQGDENDAATLINLARNTFTALKRHGITSIRLDHSGKNLEQGQRGTSAKNDDVDVVWRLTVADDGVQLRATHRRLSWVPEIVNLTRSESPLAHQLADHIWPAGTAEAAQKLEDAGAPRDISTRAAQAIIGGKRAVVVAACKYRQTMGTGTGTAIWGPSGTDTANQRAR